MARKFALTFRQVHVPITEPVTKLGGQPVWLTGPEWPLSRSTGSPMRFIGQVALEPRIFGVVPGRLAYLFMTDEADFVDGTWEPDAGENAVVIQPGRYDTGETQPLLAGPTLYQMVDLPGAACRTPAPCEFLVELESGEDPDWVDPWASDWDDETIDRYCRSVEGNKIGGTPGFLQRPEWPTGEGWRRLLQLDSTRVPFELNFGDAGVGYAFLSGDGTRGKFLWQCA